MEARKLGNMVNQQITMEKKIRQQYIVEYTDERGNVLAIESSEFGDLEVGITVSGIQYIENQSDALDIHDNIMRLLREEPPQ